MRPSSRFFFACTLASCFAAALVVNACSSSESSPSTSAEAGALDPDAAGNDGPTSTADAADSAPSPASDPLVPCTVSDSTESTSLGGLGGLGVLTDGAGKTSVILGVIAPSSSTTEVRRYTLTKANPCVLDRDTAFDISASVQGNRDFVVDGAGGIWFRHFGGALRRVSPEPVMDCTVDPSLAGESIFRFAIGPSGAVGYVTYSGGDGGVPLAARMTSTGTSCALVPIALSGLAPFPSPVAAAVDNEGRLQIVGQDLDYVWRARIFAADGKLVTSYEDVGADKLDQARGISACGSGMCVLELGSDSIAPYNVLIDQVAYFGAGEKLVKLAKAKVVPSGHIGSVRVAGGTLGPVVVAMTQSDPDAGLGAPEHILLQLGPPAP